jgi:putative addiction module component (TIGR02574 family)
MAARVARVLSEALRLPPNARASVAGSLILSLERGVDADVETAWAEEIDRRLDRFEKDKRKAVSWETVKAEIARSRRARKRS